MAEENEDLTVEKMGKVLDLVVQSTDKRFRMLEDRLETMEKLHAKLAIAYAELGSSVEAVIAEIMAPRSEEERQQFREEMNRRFTETLNMIQEVTNESASKNTDQTIDSALAKLAEKRKDSATDE